MGGNSETHTHTYTQILNPYADEEQHHKRNGCGGQDPQRRSGRREDDAEGQDEQRAGLGDLMRRRPQQARTGPRGVQVTRTMLNEALVRGIQVEPFPWVDAENLPAFLCVGLSIG